MQKVLVLSTLHNGLEKTIWSNSTMTAKAFNSSFSLPLPWCHAQKLSVLFGSSSNFYNLLFNIVSFKVMEAKTCASLSLRYIRLSTGKSQNNRGSHIHNEPEHKSTEGLAEDKCRPSILQEPCQGRISAHSTYF